MLFQRLRYELRNLFLFVFILILFILFKMRACVCESTKLEIISGFLRPEIK